ncbi:MAG: HAMP domain-containing sensor histidine kinase [Bacteroidota bacterium]
MNKKNIIFIIILMTFALIGLVGLQLYWIKNAIAVEEANFRRSVDEAISIVITKLEKKEITSQLNKYKERTILINTIDSLNRLLYKEQQKYPGIDEESHTSDDTKVSNRKIDVSSWENYNGETTLYHDTSIVITENPISKEQKNSNTKNIQHHKIDIDESVLNDYTVTKSKRDLLLKKINLLDDFFEDIFNLGKFKPIEKRLDPYLLDSLIFQELLKKGVKTEYEFGIFNPSRGQLIVQKTGRYSKDLLNRNYAYILFPSDMYLNPEYLMLYFPKEKSFLMMQLWLMLIVSMSLIIIIIFSFSYTVFTVFKQKKLSEMKNDFVNNMTHEIKTPISTISLACEVLGDNDIEKTEALFSTYINVIKQENKRLETLTEHILQTATLEKGQLLLRKEEIDLHQIISQAVNNVGFHVMQKSGSIEQKLKANKSIILADKVHITNLIYNLLDNANKYSPEKPKITISTENNSKGVIIKIIDYGIGISKTNQKKIFDKFSRISTGNVHDIKGFGLGLSYVKAIVTKHQGSIEIESELKKGSVFTVFLPFE